MRTIFLSALFIFSAASADAAIFKCADVPTPTPTCQFGVHICDGYGWCGPGCHTETCLPAPMPGTKVGAQVSERMNEPVGGPTGLDGQPCDVRHLWTCH